MQPSDARWMETKWRTSAKYATHYRCCAASSSAVFRLLVEACEITRREISQSALASWAAPPLFHRERVGYVEGVALGGVLPVGKKYGDIIHMQALGQSIIILNSLDYVVDLFEKRSTNYSDRFHTEIIKLVDMDWNTAIMKYGDGWRQHRRLLHQFLNQRACHAYEPQLREGAQKVLKHLRHQPKEFAYHIPYDMGATILSMTYGIEVAEKDDKYLAMAQQTVDAAAEGLIPGSFWVDFLPWLQHIPPWMPGTGWQKKVAQWRAGQTAVRKSTWQDRVNYDPSPSLATKMAERMCHLEGQAYAQAEEIAENVCGVIFPAASDTSTSTILSFIQAMVLYPEVQKRAQKQLDSVVGPARLPDFSDRASLPYICAIQKESLRWQPVVPLGFAHRCLTDDEYKGYLIPEGSLVMQNSWAILRDPEAYPKPEAFKPERFLKDGQLNLAVRDPSVAAFGGGRRICPGRHFADMLLFINIACILHTFDITPALDGQGNPIRTEPRMSSGTISHPLPFECTITPREDRAEALRFSENHSGS